MKFKSPHHNANQWKNWNLNKGVYNLDFMSRLPMPVLSKLPDYSSVPVRMINYKVTQF